MTTYTKMTREILEFKMLPFNFEKYELVKKHLLKIQKDMEFDISVRPAGMYWNELMEERDLIVSLNHELVKVDILAVTDQMEAVEVYRQIQSVYSQKIKELG